MAKFDINRYVNFGKYDLLINKSFYRNLGLTTVCLAVGIAVLSFLITWATYADTPIEQCKDSIQSSVITVAATLLFGSIAMMTIFAGYTFHNLRNKQGRITELTMPTTNLERWAWHITMTIIGGLLTCIAATICADIVHGLLVLINFGPQAYNSITAEFFKGATFAYNDLTNESLGCLSARFYLCFFIYSAIFSHICLYIFGNSVKYRYNIILTYIATQVIGFFLTVFCIIIFTNANFDWLQDSIESLVQYLDKQNLEVTANIVYFSFIAIINAVSALFLYGSYSNYRKAQITSKINK